MKFNPKERSIHFRKAILAAPKNGHMLEFGVGQGISLRWLVMCAKGRPVYGFDSFEGLPEDWIMSDDLIIPAGSWKYDQPDIRGVEYMVGEFSDTIPEWKETHPGMIAFIHIDSDLYSSCVTVLEELNKQIVPGTIIVFDDMYETPRYKNWEEGEYKAFLEWKEKYEREAFELNRTRDGEATFRIIK